MVAQSVCMILQLTIAAFASKVHDSRTAQAQNASSWVVYRAILVSLHCTDRRLELCAALDRLIGQSLA